jgi:hypothetical protein
MRKTTKRISGSIERQYAFANREWRWNVLICKEPELEEEHPCLFWILPTYSVAESKSARPLTARGKFRLFVKDKTDPFTIAG